MGVPALTPQQREAAMRKAVQARQARAQVKADLKSSVTTLPEVLARSEVDPVLAKLKVVDLLKAIPKVGQVKAAEIMQRLGIAESRRLGGLGVHQIEALLKEFAQRE